MTTKNLLSNYEPPRQPGDCDRFGAKDVCFPAGDEVGGQLLLGSADDDVTDAAAALTAAGAPVQPVSRAVRDGAVLAPDGSELNGGRSMAVTVRGPGGAGVVPAAVQLVSDVAERRLQRLLEKLRSEGFALGMRLTAWLQAR